MEYLVYLAAILVPLSLCIYKIKELGRHATLRKTGHGIGSENSALGKADNDEASGSLQQTTEVRDRELLKVPIPWGWPGNPDKHEAHYVHKYEAEYTSDSSESSATLHRWVDQLVSSKQTTDNQDYQHRRESSMRALLEDRFVSPKQMTKIEYKKTKPPLLRDPSEPHDQMDNFPAGRIDKIETRLRESTDSDASRNRKMEPVTYEESPALVSPWGW